MSALRRTQARSLVISIGHVKPIFLSCWKRDGRRPAPIALANLLLVQKFRRVHHRQGVSFDVELRIEVLLLVGIDPR